MKMSEATGNDSGGPNEWFSRRVQNGVEIVEHEARQIIKVSGPHYETVLDAPVAPRLIITEAPPAARPFIAKARSEIAGLDALLGALTRPALKAK